MTSLFGGVKQPGSFGGTTTTTQPLLFGNSTATPATGGLFGASQPAASTGMFGAPTTQPASTGIFGAPAAKPAGTSLFGASTQSAQPAQQNNFGGSIAAGLNASTGVGALNAQTQKELVSGRLQAVGLSGSTREKTVLQQVETLYNKWDPNNEQTLMQTYLYNSANAALAPFYHPEPNEDERKYEEALAKKPEPVDGNAWVPVWTRGFQLLGERVKYQAQFVQSMQTRLHEMNNALDAIMQKHAQVVTVRIDASKRKHAAISARALRLAVKCQILRNRGYALDVQEDQLRSTLLDLEKKVQDPAYQSREEQIWARMVMLRERSRWLEEEGKRLGANAGAASTETIPKEILDQARRILRDYDAQIQQLAKEIGAVTQDFTEWQETKGR